MKSILFGLLLLLNFGAIAQHASVVIKSGHEKKMFQASINKFLLNQTPANNLKVTGLVPQGKYLLEIRIYNDTSVFKTTVNILDVGFYHLYEINETGIQLKKIAPDFEKEEPGQLIVKFGVTTVDTIILATALKMDSVLTEIEDYYQMPNYNGKIGCPWPLTNDNFSIFKTSLNNRRLEDDKLFYAKEFLTNECLISEQVGEVLRIFEYEDSKLDFATFMYQRTYDLDHFLLEIRQQFKLENSIELLKQELKIVEK